MTFEPTDQPETPATSSPEPTRAQALLQRTQAAVGHAVVGMETEVEAALTALLAGGHLLLEGPPGVAKTLFVRALSTALGADFGRVQFTPDLMPADVTGTNVFRPDQGSFQFLKGPVFAQLLLCDEINRAPAKTQSSLLEAMQEGATTVDGVRHSLPEPFCVFATMNPLEHEGTYPLPEAQLDRFLFKLLVAYPNPATESRLLQEAHGRSVYAKPSDLGVEVVSSAEELLRLRDEILSVTVREDLCEYVVRLLQSTRSDPSLLLGGSPRAGVMLVRAAKARASLAGRDFVTPDDLKFVFLPGLRHRVQLDPGEEIEGGSVDLVLRRILDAEEVPR